MNDEKYEATKLCLSELHNVMSHAEEALQAAQKVWSQFFATLDKETLDALIKDGIIELEEQEE